MIGRAIRKPGFLVALIVMVTCAAGMSAAIKAYRIHLDKLPVYPESGRLLSSLPQETESWIGTGDQTMAPEILEVLGTDNYLSRNFIQRTPEGSEKPVVLDFHAAYYTDTIDTVPHVPERCFVGGGLQIGKNPQVLPLKLDTSRWYESPRTPEEFSQYRWVVRLPNDFTQPQYRGARVRLPADPHEMSIRVTEFLDPNGGRLYAGYFFIANGGAVASAYGVRELAFSLTDDYAYYLKVQVTCQAADSPEEFVSLVESLLGELIGDVMHCVPDWVDVQTGAWPPGNPRAQESEQG